MRRRRGGTKGGWNGGSEEFENAQFRMMVPKPFGNGFLAFIKQTTGINGKRVNYDETKQFNPLTRLAARI